MSFATFLTGIPLVVSLPTILLSSVLTVQLPQDQGATHQIFLHYQIPIFQALATYFVFHSIVPRFLKDELQRWKVFLLNVTIFVMNSYMGPIQTVLLLVVIVAHLSNMMEGLKFVYIIPNIILSFAIEYLGNKNYVDIVLCYALYTGLWWGFSNMETKFLSIGGKKLNLSKTLVAVLILNMVSTIVYLLFCKPLFVLQKSMSVVFIGSVLLFTISVQYLYEEFVKKMEANDQDQISKTKPQWIIGLIGFISMMFQYLSLKVVNYVSILQIVFILYNMFFMQKQCHFHNSLTKLKDEEPNTEESFSKSADTFDDNKSMFLQLAMTKETRSIFSFLLLNTSFMFVQLLYSFRSKSLGLLSDSLHMALDCTSLFLGLCAGVLAKKPPNAKYPLGLKYLETLAGFTNGVLLVGIVCGIFVEAFERIFTKSVVVRDTTELLIVSILGLLVNLTGLVAFDHGIGSEGHSDNMKGIFLHILADTLGSVGVIVSTILMKIFKNSLFDPIASILIASLILVSSIPLLESSSKPLLLKLDDKHHNLVKDALNKIQCTPGIVGYTTPRFWQNNVDVSHAHSHSHSEGHTHEIESTSNSVVNHEERHDHDHGHGHSHEHESHRVNSHDHAHSSNGICPETHAKHKAPAKLCGYIHIQYRDGENSVIIKKRCEKIFEDSTIDAFIQVESDSSTCWCRR